MRKSNYPHMYENLGEFLAYLEDRGELARVRVPVDTDQEIAEIADRVAKNGGKALLFENTGTPFPLAINMFGSDERMAAALGVKSLDDIPRRIEKLAAGLLSPKEALSDKAAMLPLLKTASHWFPKKSKKRGRCQETVLTGREAKLSLLPILKCWPHDGGRFITLPLVNTVDPVSGTRNVGMYRMQVVDDHTTGMHWHVHKTGAKHYEAYKNLGRRMPVSVCLGGDPVYTYSAVAPMPEGLDEYLLAGFLRGKPVKLVKCVTNDLWVPDDCDFVIEGYVDPAEEKFMEGPFGDHTGFYSLEDLYPYFHVEAITFRRGAVYPATIVGIPPQEDLYMAKATEKIFLAPIRLIMQPEIRDMYMPEEGVAHNLAIINIHRRYAGQAAKVASSLWGAGQMMFNKYMLVVSTDRDIRDPETIAVLLRGTAMEGNIIRGEGVLDVLDHATATPGKGGKLAIDLTGADENAEYVWRRSRAELRRTGGITSWDLSFVRAWGILVLRCEPKRYPDVARFLEFNKIDNIRIVVTVDESDLRFGFGEMVWVATANSDPARDAALVNGALVIDGRTKPSGDSLNPARFPNVVASSGETVALVDIRWPEYRIGEFIGSPSDRYSLLIQSDRAEI